MQDNAKYNICAVTLSFNPNYFPDTKGIGWLAELTCALRFSNTLDPEEMTKYYGG